MVVVVVSDDGKVERIRCRKIEPATLNQGKLFLDEERLVDIRDVIKIVEG